MTPKAYVTLKKKKGESGFIKIKNFCASNDTNIKVKRQLIEWEKHLQIIYRYTKFIYM